MEKVVTDMENKPSADTAHSNGSHEEKHVIELPEFLPKHRKAILHVRNFTGDAHHKFPLFLLDASHCGSFAYWSITGLLASLRMKKYSSDGCRRSIAWYRVGVQYELGYLETASKDDAAVMKHKLGCTELIILLLARWSFGPKKMVVASARKKIALHANLY